MPIPSRLPAIAGVGFKPQHFADIISGEQPIGFVEVHAENYMGAGGPPHAQLGALRERYALSVHGVGLSIGELGASWHLSRVIGPARAAEISFTGRTVKAEEAVRMGLANRIVPAEGEQIVTAAIELAEAIAENGAEGIRATKNSLIRNAEIDSFLSALELENRSQVVVKTTL